MIAADPTALTVPKFAERELLVRVMLDPASTADAIRARWPSPQHLVPATEALIAAVEVAVHLRTMGVQATPAIVAEELRIRGTLGRVQAVLHEAAAAADSIRAPDGISLDAGDVEYLLGTILEASQRRRVLLAAESLARVAKDPDARAEDVLAATDRVARLRSEVSPSAAGDGDAGALAVRTAAEIVADADEAAESFLWDGVLARGLVSLLAAAAKTGKSWLLAALVAALSTGRPWLGVAHDAVGVLYVSEEGPRTIRRRFRRFGVVAEIVHVVTVADIPAEWGWRRKIDAILSLAAKTGAGLVVLDTILNLADLPPDAANDDGAVRAALAPLTRGAAEHNIAILAVHHTRKAGGDGGAAIFGANAFRSVPDVLIELSREGGEDSPDRRLRVRGRLEDGAGAYLVRHVPGDDGTPDAYESLGSPAEERARKAEGKVLVVLNEADEWLSKAVVHGRAKGRKSENYAALDRLADAGRIQRRGLGRRGNGTAYARLGVPDSADTVRGGADETEAAS